VGGFVKADPKTPYQFVASLTAVELQSNPQVLAVRLMDGEPLWGDQETTGLRRYLLCPGAPTVWPGRQYRMAMDGLTGELSFIHGGPTSYAFNMVGFVGPIRFPIGVRDGTSQTIAFTTKYYESYS
jgi:hypothetical protein